MTVREDVPISAKVARADMMMSKPEKKSETIEVRMAYSQKQTFMETCKRNGKNASNVIREYVDAYVAPKRAPNGFGLFTKWVLVPTGLVALVAIITLVGFVSFTFSEEASDSLFKFLDTNSDGIVSSADINEENLVSVTQFLKWADADSDGNLTRDEFDVVKTFHASGFGEETQDMGVDGKNAKVFSVELGVDKEE